MAMLHSILLRLAKLLNSTLYKNNDIEQNRQSAIFHIA